MANHILKVPHWYANDIDELNRFDDWFLSCGYEGTIIRDPDGKYKQGRSTVREGGYLRIKRFVEGEGIVCSVEEGETNNNPTQTNELGNTFRSTHKENMIPNGMIGNLWISVCKNIYDPQDKKKILLHEGQEIKIAAGCMTEVQRIEYFKDQSKILGRVVKFQFFPKGQKDKPRFPTFQTFRAESDIGVE